MRARKAWAVNARVWVVFLCVPVAVANAPLDQHFCQASFAVVDSQRIMRPAAARRYTSPS